MDEAELARLYPDYPASALAVTFGCSEEQIYRKAAHMGLEKSEAFKAGPMAGRWTGNEGIAYRFQKGQEPPNKGLRRPGWSPGRMGETQFKKGEMSGAAQHNYVPIGTERLSKDGYLERKVTDDHPVPARRWVGVHRIVWEAANGPIPAGFAVAFLQGKRTAVAAEITLDRLELVSRAELMRRNSYHTNFPKEVAQLIQLKGAINRKINRLSRGQKQ